MTDQIIRRSHIAAKANRDYQLGRTAADCPFHPWTAAYETWHEQFALLNRPQQHSAPGSVQRVDLAQGA